MLPEYLRNAATESGAVIDYRDWQIPLGRRFRALKLWFVLRWYGAQGLRAHVRSGIRHAAWFADRLRDDSRFEIVTPHPFSLVCFRLSDPAPETGAADADEINAELLARVNATGRAYLTHTRVGSRYTLRFAVGSPLTGSEHVADAWRLISDIATELIGAEPAAAGRKPAAAKGLG